MLLKLPSYCRATDGSLSEGVSQLSTLPGDKRAHLGPWLLWWVGDGVSMAKGSFKEEARPEGNSNVDTSA